MARVKITMYREVEPEESDENDPTGLTEAAFNEVMSQLIGFDDVDIERVDD